MCLPSLQVHLACGSMPVPRAALTSGMFVNRIFGPWNCVGPRSNRCLYGQGVAMLSSVLCGDRAAYGDVEITSALVWVVRGLGTRRNWHDCTPECTDRNARD